MKEVPLEERPREKLIVHGVESLSNEELLILLLRSGFQKQSVFEIAKKVLYSVDSLSDFRNLTYAELSKISGIGSSKACIILAAIEFGSRIYQHKKMKMVIKDQQDVYNLVYPHLGHVHQEHFLALYLDNKSQLIAMETIFIGGLNISLVHPREVFKLAVKHSAYSIVLVHNHPSGDVSPSVADIELTKTFQEIGRMMDIRIVDHLIIAHQKVHSIVHTQEKKLQRLR